MSYNIKLTLAAILAALVGWCLHEPVSLLIYRIAEPGFHCPVNTGLKFPEIRNDALGDGEFGAKRQNGRTHSGVDILAPMGTPVFASKSGLAFTGNVPTGYGRYVMIYHPDGYVTMYGHLSASCVGSVRKVHRGELIGFVGKTGNAANKYIQPHLHFEIKKDGEYLDPAKLLR